LPPSAVGHQSPLRGAGVRRRPRTVAAIGSAAVATGPYPDSKAGESPEIPLKLQRLGPVGDWYGARVPAWISLNRDGLALVGGPGAYSSPTGPADPTVRLSFVDAVQAPILPAV